MTAFNSVRLVSRRARTKVVGQRGIIAAVFAGGGFVKNFAQAVEIGLRRAGAFGRDVAFGANNRTSVARIGHESDVSQLRHAADENDVGRLDVTVHKAVRVQVRERGGQGAAEFDDFGGRKASASFEFGAERFGKVRRQKAE